MSDDLRFTLGIEPDEQSANEARRMVDDVQQVFEDLKRKTKDAAEQIQSFFKSPGSNQVEKELKQTKEAAEQAKRAIQDMNDAKAKGGSGIGDTAGQAGSFASAAAGATGIQEIGMLGDLGDVLEQGGKLGEMLPQTASGLASLGVAGAAAGVAIVAASVALNDYNEGVKAQAEALKNAFEAQRSVAEFAASGASEEEARARLDELKKQLETEKEILSERQEAYQQFEDSFDPITEGILKAVDGREQAIADAVDESSAAVGNYESEIRRLTEAIDEGKFAAQEAASALLDQAAAAGDLLRLELEAGEATKEANESRLKGVERQRAALQRELEVLQAAGSEHEDVAERIQALTQQMQNLDQQSQVLKTAIQNAGDSAEESAKQIEGATDTRKSESREIEKTSKEVKGSMLIIGGMQNKMMQAQVEHVQKQAEVEMKAYEDQRKAAIAHNQKVLESIEDFNAKRDDLLTSGDFLGAGQQERDFRRDLSRMQNQYMISQGTTINNNVGNINFPTQTAMNPQQFEEMMRGYARQEIQTILVNP